MIIPTPPPCSCRSRAHAKTRACSKVSERGQGGLDFPLSNRIALSSLRILPTLFSQVAFPLSSQSMHSKMPSTYSSEYVITVDVTDYDHCKFASQYTKVVDSFDHHTATLTAPPASDVQYCQVITATIKDKFSSAKIGSATAFYINTQRLDEDGEQYAGGYEEITGISPIVDNLVELDIWMSPVRIEWLDEEPEYGHDGLILHEMQIEPAFRRQGLGRSKLCLQTISTRRRHGLIAARALPRPSGKSVRCRQKRL